VPEVWSRGVHANAADDAPPVAGESAPAPERTPHSTGKFRTPASGRWSSVRGRIRGARDPKPEAEDPLARFEAVASSAALASQLGGSAPAAAVVSAVVSAPADAMALLEAQHRQAAGEAQVQTLQLQLAQQQQAVQQLHMQLQAQQQQAAAHAHAASQAQAGAPTPSPSPSGCLIS